MSNPIKVTGRPPKFKTPIAMARKINAYFKRCHEDREPLTVAGLCLELGFYDHKGLLKYKGKPEFVPIIGEALMGIKAEYERRAIVQGNVAGVLFLLKVLGYEDKRSLEVTGANGKPLEWQIKVVKADATGPVRERLPGGGSGEGIEGGEKPAFQLVESPKVEAIS